MNLHANQLTAWGLDYQGFEGIDLEDYEVCQRLGPFVVAPMQFIECLDLRVERVELKGDAVWVFPDQECVAEGRDLKADAVVKFLPPELLDRVKELSKGPRVPWPVPTPPDGVQAKLDRLDELLFSKDTKPGLVFMNAQTYADVRKWHRVRQDFITDMARLKMGWYATLYRPDFDPETAEKKDFNAGWQIWITRLVPPGSIYIDTSGGYGPLKEAPAEDILHSLEVESSP